MPLGWIAGATVATGVLGAISSSNAAGAQESSANNATALQNQIYQQTVQRNQPFVTAGTGAANQLSNLLGTSGNTGASGYGSLTGNFTAADYLANQDPGYGFQLQTGEQAVENAATPGGSALGGQALKGLNNFAQGTAATGYQNAFNRYTTQQNNVYSRLAGLAGLGQASANNTAAAGSSFGQSAGSNIIGAGNASAAGTIGVANALGGAANNAAGYYYLNSLNGQQPFTPVNTGTLPGGNSVPDVPFFSPTG